MVDDMEENRDLLVRRLQRQGLETAEAVDGSEALELLHSAHFDLVLLDIMMPVLDGFHVLEQIKANPELRELPVIVISAMNEIESAARCIELGADDYLTKPFNPVLLRARVNACLEKKAFRDRERKYLSRIEQERVRADRLLGVLFPDQVIEELKRTGSIQPKAHEEVAVLFADIVGFTAYCRAECPGRVVELLQEVMCAFEDVCLRHEIHKTKTIGDCFMATSGLIVERPDPALNAVRAGTEMIAVLRELVPEWQLRVGVHMGPLISGVVGRRQYLYDVWGDTVNTAQRVEQHGVPGGVVVSEVVHNAIRAVIPTILLGEVDAKNRGALRLFRVV